MNRRISYAEALLEATQQEMSKDPSVIVLGMGVDDFRGIYGTTRGLVDEFGPDRVFDTPLSEDGMTGVAIGAALGGLRPIHVHIRMDFLLLAMNQLVNIAAKSRYMYGGAVSVPIVVRSIIGKSWGQGAQHSQGLHSFFMHVPGLKVVAPSTPYDAKGCLTRAIRDPNPVMFVEHRMVHYQKGEVPKESYEIPFGRARVLAPGKDVTIVGISYMAIEAMRAHAMLAEVGIDAEILDPVSLHPLDVEGIAASVRKTGRLLVVDCAWTTCGATAEITTAVLEALGTGVRFRRLGHAPVTCPTTKSLENLYYPNSQTIAHEAYALVRGDSKGFHPKAAVASEVIEFKGPF
jgi:acetoin:2,6-dichlorophenolindophenol oxidoreductase subunit beta